MSRPPVAIEKPAGTGEGPRRPTGRVRTGIALILLSYALAWPLIAAVALVSVRLEKPLVAVIGGAIAYGVSWGIMFFGTYLAGEHYGGALLRRVIHFLFGGRSGQRS
jgi:hypothetical protein